MTSELAELHPELAEPEGIATALAGIERQLEELNGARLWADLGRARQTEHDRIPDWCLFPRLWVQANFGGPEVSDDPSIMSPDTALATAATALANWRPGRGTYIFDADLAELIDASVGAEDIPNEVFMRLPEFGMFVSCVAPNGGCPGAFVWLDIISLENPTPVLYLGIWRKPEENPHSLIEPIPIPLAGASAFKSYQAVHTPNPLVDFNIDEYIRRVLLRLAYLTTPEPDIRGRLPCRMPRRVTPKRWQKPRQTPTEVWEVGYRIAREIRAARETEHGQGGGGLKRPHLRRAHWHTYRVGKGRQETELKFLLPIIVGGSTDSAPVVIRPQEPTR